MKRIAIAGGLAALLVSSVAVSTMASADPVLNPTTNMAVATGVSDFVAAEEARIAAEEARIAAEQAAAEAARKAWENDMSGIGPSAYTGDYYVPGADATRQCIVRKESTGNYRVVSSNGMYHGAYQFMLGTSNNAARKMGRPDLVGTPASQWSRYEQDMAFWVTWNHGSGRGNWPTARGC